MRRKLVAMLTAATLVVGMLAGCGGGSDSKDAKEPATSDSADKGEVPEVEQQHQKVLPQK